MKIILRNKRIAKVKLRNEMEVIVNGLQKNGRRRAAVCGR